MISYRPGIMRIPGARNRAQAMNDGFGEIPSLLDSLVFYPVWIGPQCVDMIGGSPLTNAGTVTAKTEDPTGSVAGEFGTGKSLSVASTASISVGASSFSVMWWAYPTSKPAYAARIIGKRLNNSSCDLDLYISNLTDRFTFNMQQSSGTSNLIAADSFGSPPLAWSCVKADRDLGSNTIGIAVNGGKRDQASLTGLTMSGASSSTLYIGDVEQIVGSRNWAGYLGSGGIWRRILSDREWHAYYANGQGINLSQYF